MKPHVALAPALFLAVPALADVQTVEQQGCTTGVENSFAKMVKALGKETSSCLKDIASSRTTAGACLGSDPKGKVAKSCKLNNPPSVDTIHKSIAASCAGVDPAAAFPGCDTADAETLHGCLAGREACLACDMLAELSDTRLSTNCDLLDDGAHDDVLVSENGPDSDILGPLGEFLARNVQ